LYTRCAKRTFVEDNEMRSLKRIFFACASITFVYMKTGKRKEQEFIVAESPADHVKNDAADRPPGRSIDRESPS